MKIFKTTEGLNYIMAKPAIAKLSIADMIQKILNEEKLANRSKTIKTIVDKSTLKEVEL